MQEKTGRMTFRSKREQWEWIKVNMPDFAEFLRLASQVNLGVKNLRVRQLQRKEDE